MKKIIVKCKLRKKNDFLEKLYEIDMKFGEVFYLHDRIYVPRQFQWGMNYPRLVMRTTMRAVDKAPVYEMILKRHIEDSGVDVVDRTAVKDYTEAVNIIHQLGFRELAEVSRQRQELKMSELVIILDKVEGLPGHYVKIESPLLNGESAQATRADLKRTLEVLGQKDLTAQTYTELKRVV